MKTLFLSLLLITPALAKSTCEEVSRGELVRLLIAMNPERQSIQAEELLTTPEYFSEQAVKKIDECISKSQAAISIQSIACSFKGLIDQAILDDCKDSQQATTTYLTCILSSPIDPNTWTQLHKLTD